MCVADKSVWVVNSVETMITIGIRAQCIEINVTSNELIRVKSEMTIGTKVTFFHI